ncbi:MAG: aspartate ammonia-lyase [Planctomycetota bacterium]|nr:aspartate ammonia-lyase [Planctomycetota bacterium]
MDDVIDLLAASELFSGLDRPVLATLAPAAHRRTLEEGTVLFAHGDPRTAFFLVVRGELEIRVEESGISESLALMGPGRAIGEAGLLEPGVHMAEGRACCGTEVLEFDLDDVRERLASDGQAALAVMAATGRILVRRMQYAGHRRVGWDQAYGPGDVREERDLLGTREVPSNARYGIQTLRAVENFPITGIHIGHFPTLIRALAMVKKAAARANHALDLLDGDVAEAIDDACDEILDGHWHGHFVVDVLQGGAGTSTNMNANEVIANRALEILGHPRGAYEYCHPNNHVNLSQSTNDAYPTAIRVATVLEQRELGAALRELVAALRIKAQDFGGVLKMGRTQLQDAVPMTLGMEMEAFAVTTAEDVARLDEAATLMLEVNLGGTAIGTGINADPRYQALAVDALRDISGLELVSAENLIEATADTGAYVHFSGVLKRIAVKLSKICNDLRLLSSGPRCGLGELNLPAMQPGSSIMPGKVNPVIPEVVNQVAFNVIGNDLAITMAAEAGQLQLNVMEPLITFNLFESMNMLTAAVRTLTSRCIRGITANPEHTRHAVEHSIGLVTAVVPVLGYERASEIAKEALNTGRSVREILLAAGDLDESAVNEILSPEAMTSPRPMQRPTRDA